MIESRVDQLAKNGFVVADRVDFFVGLKCCVNFFLQKNLSDCLFDTSRTVASPKCSTVRKECVAAAFEKLAIVVAVKRKTVGFEPIRKRFLLASTFWMSKTRQVDVVAVDETAVAGENHVGKTVDLVEREHLHAFVFDRVLQLRPLLERQRSIDGAAHPRIDCVLYYLH